MRLIKFGLINKHENIFYSQNIKKHTTMIKRLTFLIAVILVAQSAFASAADLFSYDNDALQTEFAEIQQLEDYVVANGDLSLTEVQATSAEVLEGINFNILETASPVGAMFSIEDMDWGSFAWGFCCWPVGFFVVAINNNKTSDQKLSFWIGLGVSVVLSVISNFTVLAGSY